MNINYHKLIYFLIWIYFRLTNCQRSKHIQPLSSLSFDDIRRLYMLVQYIFFILIPPATFFAILSNITVIYVIHANRKDLKENQYKYMAANSIVNVAFLLIQPFGLLNECQRFDGWFCSQARKSLAIQYFKIIFLEYMSNLLRLVSNLTYVGFAINRSSLIGREHSKLVNYVSTLSVKQFLTRVIWPCIGLSVVKVFSFVPNVDRPFDSYPRLYLHHLFDYEKFVRLFILLSFKLVNDLINGVFFLIVNLIIDICLIIKMKKTLSQKTLIINSIKIK